MAYFEYMKALLKPMRIYALYGGAGAMELSCEGAQMDMLQGDIDESERESAVFTALSYGLSRYREILPFFPDYGDISELRRALAAMLQIDGRSFTEEALNATISGCGVLAAVTEADIPQTVIVTFPGTRGEPENFETVKERVEAIIPCHLNILYLLAYLRWCELEERYLDWIMLEDAGKSWRELEKSS